jgi:hypothetical protein
MDYVIELQSSGATSRLQACRVRAWGVVGVGVGVAERGKGIEVEIGVKGA